MCNVQVKFQQWVCRVSVKSYSNGGIALELWDDEGPVAVATVWIKKLPYGQAAIKDYSENEGMVEALQDAGLLKEFVEFIPSGWIVAPVYKLNMEALGLPAEEPKNTRRK